MELNSKPLWECKMNSGFPIQKLISNLNLKEAMVFAIDINLKFVAFNLTYFV